jgi:hypothetical protein
MSPDDPVMIRLPKSAIKYLKAGDTIDATFEKAKDGKYWVIQMFMFVLSSDINLESKFTVSFYSGLDSGTEKLDENKLYWTKRGGAEEIFNGLRLSDSDETGSEEKLSKKVKDIRSTAEYQNKKEILLRMPPPEDRLFPEEMFTDDWFAGRETDIGSDDEIGTMWNSIDDEESEDWPQLDYV